MNQDERQRFLDGIKQNPLDGHLRCVFADWLEEHGEDDEALRQRQWLPAFTVLKYIVFPYIDEYPDEYLRTPILMYEGVMAEVNYWKWCVEGGDSPSFGNTTAQEKLQDVDARTEFWKAFTVITGIDPPDDIKDQECYHCAC